MSPMKLILQILMIAGLLVFASGCTTTDFVTGKGVQNMYSLTEDVQLGGQCYTETVAQLQEANAPINSDPVRVAMVQEVTDNITAIAHITNLPYEVTYIGDPEFVNAFAFPGGNIMVFEGLWDEENGLVRTIDELAAVIAHEIAHVNCRHSTEAMTRQMLPNLILTAGMIYAAVEDDEDMQLIMGGLMLVHNGLIVTKYSRRDELEADRVGMMYMAKAGYNPEAAPIVWERLAGASDDQVNKVLSIFSTHPRDYLRVKELRKHLPEARAAYAAAPVKRNGTLSLAMLPPLVNNP